MVHPTLVYQEGLSPEALLQLELRKLEVEEKVEWQWQFEEAEKQRQFEVEKSRLEFITATRVSYQVPIREDCQDEAS